jgi:hypothetical protein
VVLVDGFLQYSADAHRHFRGPGVDPTIFRTTSASRFYDLYESYRMTPDPVLVRNKLQAYINSNTKNVALVVAQGLLAQLTGHNAAKILERAVEAPEEWLHIVAADDGLMFIGGWPMC